LVGKTDGKRHSEDLAVDGKISEWMLGKYGGKTWTGCIWIGTAASDGLL
jgi:hypothetical protein